MTPDEVITALQKNGVFITRKTLLNYEHNGFIPKAKRGELKHGKGTYTDYPAATVVKAIETYTLLRWCTVRQLQYYNKQEPEAQRMLREFIVWGMKL